MVLPLAAEGFVVDKAEDAAVYKVKEKHGGAAGAVTTKALEMFGSLLIPKIN